MPKTPRQQKDSTPAKTQPSQTNFFQTIGSYLFSPVSYTYNAVHNGIANWVKADAQEIIENLKVGKCVILETYDDGDVILKLKKVNDQQRLGIVGSTGRIKFVDEPWEQKIIALVDKLELGSDITKVTYESSKNKQIAHIKKELKKNGLLKHIENSIILYAEKGKPIKRFKCEVELELFLREKLLEKKNYEAVRRELKEADKQRVGTFAFLLAITTGGMALAPIAFDVIEILGASFRALRDVYNFKIGPTGANAAASFASESDTSESASASASTFASQAENPANIGQGEESSEPSAAPPVGPPSDFYSSIQ